MGRQYVKKFSAEKCDVTATQWLTDHPKDSIVLMYYLPPGIQYGGEWIVVFNKG